MKTLPILLFFAGLLASLVSCSSTDYFLKQADDNDPHATLYLRNGSTQVIKIDGKYPPEDAPHTVRLEPGFHTVAISHQAHQVGILGGLLGAPGQDLNTQTTMQLDLVPGKTYRPGCNVSRRGSTFFLIDESGLRSNFSRAYTRTY